MSATLQDAINAARGGDTEQALWLAADVARQHPDDANAWYLLSQLVDSDARRAAYLSKTLALNPGHERARVELAALPPEVTAALVGGPPLSAVEAVAEPEPVVATTAESGQVAAGDGVPDWLRPLGAEPVQATPEAVAPEEPAQPAAAARPPVQQKPKRKTPPPPPPRRRGNQALTFLLVLLVLLTLAVLVFLGFLLLTG